MDELQGGSATNRLIPLERLLTAFPVARLTAEGRERVAHGRELDPAHLEEASWADRGDTWVRLIDPNGQLAAVATAGSRPGSLHPTVVLI
jgi:hypothetical protein